MSTYFLIRSCFVNNFKFFSMATANRFTTFRDPEDTAAFEATKAAQAKRGAPKEAKKVVVRPKAEET